MSDTTTGSGSADNGQVSGEAGGPGEFTGAASSPRLVGTNRTAEARDKCARCGKDPADGYAFIGDKRFCHGDDQDPTCYMRASWERAGTPSPKVGSLVGPNRTMDPATLTALAHLHSARTDLDMAEHHLGVVGYNLQDRPDDQAAANRARALLQQSHALLWELSRELAGDHPPVPL